MTDFLPVVCIPFPVASHFYSFFGIAARFRMHGHKVVIVGEERFRTLVESERFEFASISAYPFAQSFENVRYASYLDVMVERITGRLFELREDNLNAVVTEHNPAYVFIDSMLSTDLIVLYEHVRRNRLCISFVQTMLCTDISVRHPLLSSRTLPTQKIKICLDYIGQWVTRRVKLFIAKVKYLGYDDISMVKRRMRERKCDRSLSIDVNRLFGIGFRGVREYILVPSNFDFASKFNGRDRIYIGFNVYLRRSHHAMDFECEMGVRKMIEDRERRNQRLIYCAFGTFALTGTEIMRLKELMRKLLACAERMPTCNFVFAVNGKVVRGLTLPSCDNIMIRSFLPQLDMLSSADVFITHGGLNSIKEAIHFNVPMLVYPFDGHFDGFGNAARVCFFEIGLAGSIRNDSVETINAKLQHIIDFRHNFVGSIEKIKRNGGSIDIRELIT